MAKRMDEWSRNLEARQKLKSYLIKRRKRIEKEASQYTWSQIKPIAKKVFDNKKLTMTERSKWNKWWELKKVI